MTAADVRHYIGLNGSRTFWEIREDVQSLEEAPLREVVGDLTSRGSRGPLVRDSRQVTVYGQVLQHPLAHEILRRHEDLEVARQVVELAELPERIRVLQQRISVTREEAERAEHSTDLLEATEDLFRAARSLRSTVRDLADD